MVLAPLEDKVKTVKDFSLPKLMWITEALQAFYLMKDILAEATLLSHPKPDAPLCIMTDASNVAVGAVLQQQVNNVWQPLSYFSHKLKHVETKYSTFDRELLAIYLAIKHFCHYVEGLTFYIATDHKPLTFSVQMNSNKYSPQQIRQLDFISQFTSDIRHISGSNNPVADALSRLEIQVIQQGSSMIDFTAMAISQQSDQELKAIQLSISSSLNFTDIPIEGTDTTLFCDNSTYVLQPYVPKCF